MSSNIASHEALSCRIGPVRGRRAPQAPDIIEISMMDLPAPVSPSSHSSRKKNRYLVSFDQLYILDMQMIKAWILPISSSYLKRFKRS
jgi:hypothetical protein